MVFQEKTGGNHVVNVAGTAFDLVHPLATSAAEMMMVILAGHFVPVGFPGKPDRDQPSGLHKRLQVAIHRGNAQARRMALRGFQNLLRTEWPADLLKNPADCPPLARIPFHEGGNTEKGRT